MEGADLVSVLFVAGSSGQLARALKKLRPDVTSLDRAAMDLSRPDLIAGLLEKYNPSAVINAAAYTQVDNAEKEEKLAHTINVEAPAAMAKYCASRNIPFVTFSTDYVFDGSGGAAWKENDKVAPLNAYGRSKAASEKAIAAVGGKYLIFRTSWVYDALGKNFLNTILRLAGEREELRIVNDQHGAPTYAPHLAKAVLASLEAALAKPDFPSGVYHLCSAGEVTWHGFACEIVGQAKKYASQSMKVKTIQPIMTSEYPLPAKRPLNSRLDCSKVKSVFNVSMPDWREGLVECLKEKYESNRLSA
jgi:dTDP-4-dehydrorhamnose reductase